jgi:hypothetical protein
VTNQIAIRKKSASSKMATGGVSNDVWTARFERRNRHSAGHLRRLGKSYALAKI